MSNPSSANPLQFNTSIRLLHIVFYNFFLVLTRRIRKTVKPSSVGDQFYYSRDPSE